MAHQVGKCVPVWEDRGEANTACSRCCGQLDPAGADIHQVGPDSQHQRAGGMQKVATASLEGGLLRTALLFSEPQTPVQRDLLHLLGLVKKELGLARNNPCHTNARVPIAKLCECALSFQLRHNKRSCTSEISAHGLSNIWRCCAPLQDKPQAVVISHLWCSADSADDPMISLFPTKLSFPCRPDVLPPPVMAQLGRLQDKIEPFSCEVGAVCSMRLSCPRSEKGLGKAESFCGVEWKRYLKSACMLLDVSRSSHGI
eukprot:scaffold12008_cov21-Tisochrysis_lutea.AAC.1